MGCFRLPTTPRPPPPRRRPQTKPLRRVHPPPPPRGSAQPKDKAAPPGCPRRVTTDPLPRAGWGGGRGCPCRPSNCHKPLGKGGGGRVSPKPHKHLWRAPSPHCGAVVPATAGVSPLPPRSPALHRVPRGCPRSWGRSGGAGRAPRPQPRRLHRAMPGTPRHIEATSTARCQNLPGAPSANPRLLHPANTVHGHGTVHGPRSRQPPVPRRPCHAGMAGSRSHSWTDRGCLQRRVSLVSVGAELGAEWGRYPRPEPSQGCVPPGLCRQPDPATGEHRGPPRPLNLLGHAPLRSFGPRGHAIPKDGDPPAVP